MYSCLLGTTFADRSRVLTRSSDPPSAAPNLPTCPSYFIEKKKGHRARLHKKLDTYIQNHLPIYLLRLEDMRLIHRGEVQNQIRPKIEENDLTCDENACQCFEGLKNDMQFAILSHRWGRDELSFHDLSETAKPPSGESGTKLRQTLKKSKSKPGMGPFQRLQEACLTMSPDCGLTKLVKSCEIAAIKGCKFVWLDTICINKEKSAELEESIRSMYGWYRDSHVCIVHLSETTNWANMREDKWFKRGWTLQELLAPPNILFFMRDWKRLTKRRNDKDVDDIERETPPLITTISKITNIPISDLIQFTPGLYDIRKRMSWASSRETTRVEDQAYCLIGIFGISLSVAYGEREAAFYRLQGEILQRSGDMGLFHWKNNASPHNSMLAAGPECFPPVKWEEEIAQHATVSDSTYMLTNLGFRIWLKVYQPSDDDVQDALKALGDPNLAGKTIAILAETAQAGTYICLVLESTGTSKAQRYKRVGLVNLQLPSIVPNREPIEIFIV